MREQKPTRSICYNICVVCVCVCICIITHTHMHTSTSVRRIQSGLHATGDFKILHHHIFTTRYNRTLTYTKTCKTIKFNFILTHKWFVLYHIQFVFQMLRRAFIVRQTHGGSLSPLYENGAVRCWGQDRLLMETNRPETSEEMETRNSINGL